MPPLLKKWSDFLNKVGFDRQCQTTERSHCTAAEFPASSISRLGMRFKKCLQVWGNTKTLSSDLIRWEVLEKNRKTEMRQKLLITCFLLSTLTGCASVGTAFDINAVDNFKVQQTTLQDVKEKLGEPNTSTNLPDGSLMYGWTYSKSTIGAALAQSVMIKFSRDGKYLQVVHRHQVKTN